MKTKELNKLLAQGAEMWNARQDEMKKHLEIMEKLEKFCVKTERYEDSEGPFWARDICGEDVKFFCDVVRRGRHDEILFLIERYRHIYQDCKYVAYVPDEVQSLLVERNDPEEIKAFMAVYGFCVSAQDVMFATWDHQQLVSYAQKHGFCEKWQVYIFNNWPEAEVRAYCLRHGLSLEAWKLLLKRGWHEEIMTQIQVHGFFEDLYGALIERGDHDEIMAALDKRLYKQLSPECQEALWARSNDEELASLMKACQLCDSLLERLLGNLNDPENQARFEMYSEENSDGLPEAYQTRFLQEAPHELFLSYILCHGFYESQHKLLLRHRTPEEVRAYLEKHRFLSDEAEKILAREGSVEDKVLYYQVKAHHKTAFVENLLKVRPLDYAALNEIFLSFDVDNMWSNPNEENLMKTGTPAELKKYFSADHKLACRSFLTLFFRHDKRLFTAYLKGREHFYY